MLNIYNKILTQTTNQINWFEHKIIETNPKIIDLILFLILLSDFLFLF